MPQDPYEPCSILIIVSIILLLVIAALLTAGKNAVNNLSRARLKSRLLSNERTDKQKKRTENAFKLYDKSKDIVFVLTVGVSMIMALSSALIALYAYGLNPTFTAIIAAVILWAVFCIAGAVSAPFTDVSEGAAERLYGFIKISYYILYVPAFLFLCIKNLIKKAFKLSDKEGVTEEEILDIVEEAGEDGALNKSESELISNAIEFHDCEVEEILIPRVNVVSVPLSMPMDKIKQVFLVNGYSRLPVYKEDLDHIVGMIHEKDFLALMDKGGKDITPIIKKVAIATEHMKISALLRLFQKSKVHMAIVVDEYGGTAGIVTLEDVLEELVGEIWDEHDEVVEYYEKLDDNTYRVDANLSLEDFFSLFSINNENYESQTVGGFVVELLGDMPKRNDALDFMNLHIMVTRCTKKRITELKVIVKDNLEEAVNQ